MKQSKRQQAIEARRASDPIAQKMERIDIDYTDPDQLPTAPRIIAADDPIRDIGKEPAHLGEAERPVNEFLRSEGNAIAEELIIRFDAEEREGVIWYLSRRICFTCGIAKDDLDDHSHLIETGEM